MIYGFPFLEGGVILERIEDDVEVDESEAEELEEATDVIELTEVAVVEVPAATEVAVVVEAADVVNFGKPLLTAVMMAIFAYIFDLILTHFLQYYIFIITDDL